MYTAEPITVTAPAAPAITLPARGAGGAGGAIGPGSVVTVTITTEPPPCDADETLSRSRPCRTQCSRSRGPSASSSGPLNSFASPSAGPPMKLAPRQVQQGGASDSAAKPSGTTPDPPTKTWNFPGTPDPKAGGSFGGGGSSNAVPAPKQPERPRAATTPLNDPAHTGVPTKAQSPTEHHNATRTPVRVPTLAMMTAKSQEPVVATPTVAAPVTVTETKVVPYRSPGSRPEFGKFGGGRGGGGNDLRGSSRGSELLGNFGNRGPRSTSYSYQTEYGPFSASESFSASGYAKVARTIRSWKDEEGEHEEYIY
jgi:hypothetical protein